MRIESSVVASFLQTFFSHPNRPESVSITVQKEKKRKKKRLPVYNCKWPFLAVPLYTGASGRAVPRLQIAQCQHHLQQRHVHRVSNNNNDTEYVSNAPNPSMMHMSGSNALYVKDYKSTQPNLHHVALSSSLSFTHTHTHTFTHICIQAQSPCLSPPSCLCPSL